MSERRMVKTRVSYAQIATALGLREGVRVETGAASTVHGEIVVYLEGPALPLLCSGGEPYEVRRDQPSQYYGSVFGGADGVDSNEGRVSKPGVEAWRRPGDATNRGRAAGMVLALVFAWYFMSSEYGGRTMGPFDDQPQCEVVKAWHQKTRGVSVYGCWYVRPGA